MRYGITKLPPVIPCVLAQNTESRFAEGEIMAEYAIDVKALNAFLKAVKIDDMEPSVESLRRVTELVLGHVPFTNIMMLTRPKRSPRFDEITDDMLSLRGGPCGHFNPFMNLLLKHIGFESSLVPAKMHGKLSHMAIITHIDGNSWWNDFGNGHPYLSPIQLESSEEVTHAGLTYAITRDQDGGFSVRHRYPRDGDFEVDYSFENKPVEFSYFKEMIREHYTNEKFGPFLTGLRFIRFPEGEMVAIRDRELLLTKDDVLEKRQLADSSEIIDAVKEHFSQADYPIEDGLRFLGW